MSRGDRSEPSSIATKPLSRILVLLVVEYAFLVQVAQPRELLSGSDHDHAAKPDRHRLRPRARPGRGPAEQHPNETHAHVRPPAAARGILPSPPRTWRTRRGPAAGPPSRPADLPAKVLVTP